MVAKRILDVVLSSLMVSLLMPLCAVAALAIKLDSRGPVFYRQRRAGKDGRIFEVLKLRSMVQNAEKVGLGYEVAHDDARITRVGRVLRNLGLDELPQLLSVLKGEMSLVGPRAARPDQVLLFTGEERRRMGVKPGVTGWALVNGRNLVDWRKRIQLDLWYVEHRSFWLDVKILLKTLWVVLVTREGVYGPDGITRDYGH